MDKQQIANMRVEYSLKSFNEEDLNQDPIAQFDTWLNEAIQSGVNEPNAMTLATVKPDGAPSARIVLLKGLTEEGLVFFTNYDSNKGQEISANAHVALTFCWLELQRQVRVEGIAKKIDATESDEYFFSRPLNSQLGAHASPQSQELKNRIELEQRFDEMKTLFAKEPIIRPANWGGYVVSPQMIEFWQGRASRLHDRFRFSKQIDSKWVINRLAP